MNEEVRLRVLLSSGNAHECKLAQETLLKDLRVLLYNSFSQEFKQEAKLNSLTQIRLLYKGKFIGLDSDTDTLKSAGICGLSTVHLAPIVEELLETSGVSDKNEKLSQNNNNNGCCAKARCCNVL